MAKKEIKRKRINFKGKSITEISNMLKDGVKIRAYDGADIYKEEFWRGKDAVLPNSMWSNVYAQLGMNFYETKDGKIYTDEVIYMSFEYGAKDIKIENQEKVNKWKEDIKNLEGKIEKCNIKKDELPIIIDKKQHEYDAYRKRKDRDEDKKKEMEVELKNLKSKLLAIDNTIKEYENKIEKLKLNILMTKKPNLKFRKKYNKEKNIIKIWNGNKITKRKVIRQPITSKDLRRKYYTEGFKLIKKFNGKKYEYTYKVTMQNASKTRLGKCITLCDTIVDLDTGEVLREGLVKKVEALMSMGITDYLLDNPEVKISFPTLEAYTALSQSAILNGYIKLAPENILIIDDYTVDIKYKCRKVTVNDKKDDLIVGEEKEDILHNTLWDGMGLLDAEYFKGLEQYSVILLRQLFFKACMTKCNLVDYIKKYCEESPELDYETGTVKDFLGRDIPIKSIRCITTTNAIKWTKFSSYMFNGENPNADMYDLWCNKITTEWHNLWAVVKHDYETSYDSGNLVRMSYQMINTLTLSEDKNIANEEFKGIFNETERYARELQNNIDCFKDYLYNNCEGRERVESWKTLLELNDEVQDTEEFKTFRNEIIRKEIVNKAKDESRVLVNGNNLVLIGNPVELVEYALTGKFKPSFGADDIGVVKCYTPRFDMKKEIVGIRSPHNASTGFVLMENTPNKKLEELAPDLNGNVIVIDALQYPTSDSLNGQDYDIDSILATDDADFVGLVRTYCWGKNPIPINDVPMETKKYKFTRDDKCDCNLSLCNTWIGSSTNLCQIAVSQITHIKRNKNIYTDWEERVKELEEIVYGLVIATNIAIDNSKRKYDINMDKYLNKVRAKDCWIRSYLTDEERKELDKLNSDYTSIEDESEKEKIKRKINILKNKDNKIVKPSFMMNVIKDKSKENSVFQDLDCNCNNIVINYKTYKKGKGKFLNLLEKPKEGKRPRQTQLNEILELATETKSIIDGYRSIINSNDSEDEDNEGYYQLIQDAQDDFRKKMLRKKINPTTFYDIIRRLFENDDWSKLKSTLLNVLVEYRNDDGELVIEKLWKKR